MKKNNKPSLELLTREQEEMINESLSDVLFEMMEADSMSEEKKNMFAIQIGDILSRVLVVTNQKIIQKKTFEALRK